MAFREKSGIDSEDKQIRGCLISDLLSFQLSSFSFIPVCSLTSIPFIPVNF